MIQIEIPLPACQQSRKPQGSNRVQSGQEEGKLNETLHRLRRTKSTASIKHATEGRTEKSHTGD